MNRRMFAKALASVAGAIGIGATNQVAPPVPIDLPEESGLPYYPKGLPEGDNTIFPTSAPIRIWNNPWARRPSDPPLTLAQQLNFREPGRAKSHDNADRFTPCATHPVAKAKNYFLHRHAHNQYPRYHSRELFRNNGEGNPVENWIKARRARPVSTTLNDLQAELKGMRI